MDDSYFARPYTDRHEWRDEPVRHRYVHGGFDGTETRFSLYFPPEEQYAGRFLHNIEGGGGGSDEAAWSPADPLGSDVAHALAAGASFVVSNQGHDGPDATHLDRWIHHYGANVAVARVLARRRGVGVRRRAAPRVHLRRERWCRTHDRVPRARARGPVRRRGRLHPPARRAAGAVRVRRRDRAGARRRACRGRRRDRTRRERRSVRGAHRGAARRARDVVQARVPARGGGSDPPRHDRVERRRAGLARPRSRLLRRLLDRARLRGHDRERAGEPDPARVHGRATAHRRRDRRRTRRSPTRWTRTSSCRWSVSRVRGRTR